MKVFLFGVFLAVLGAGGVLPCVEGSDPENPSPLSPVSTVSEPDAPIIASGGTMLSEISETKAPVILSGAETPTSSEASDAAAGYGVDSAVRIAQQEVRDPFAVEEIEAETPEGVENALQQAGPTIQVELRGIGFGATDGYALIGGEVFYTGEEKSGIKLLEVRRREVDILVNGGKITVPLFSDQELQKAKDRAERKGAAERSLSDQNAQGPSSSPQRGQKSL